MFSYHLFAAHTLVHSIDGSKQVVSHPNPIIQDKWYVLLFVSIDRKEECSRHTKQDHPERLIQELISPRPITTESNSIPHLTLYWNVFLLINWNYVGIRYDMSSLCYEILRVLQQRICSFILLYVFHTKYTDGHILTPNSQYQAFPQHFGRKTYLQSKIRENCYTRHLADCLTRQLYAIYHSPAIFSSQFTQLPILVTDAQKTTTATTFFSFFFLWPLATCAAYFYIKRK